MHKTFDFKKYVEYKVYSVTTIKNGYGFRVLLTFADESKKTQQQLHCSTDWKDVYVYTKSGVYQKII